MSAIEVKLDSMIKPAAGLYPTHLDLDQAMEMADFVRRNRSDLVAIGEVGLDYLRLGQPTSQLLLPLCFAAHSATMLTLLGAPLNVLVWIASTLLIPRLFPF